MNINIELLTKLGFYKDEHLTQEYYDCYRLYNYFLLSYLNEKIHLTKLEEEALTMKNPFKPLSLDEKDFFQKLSPLKFFYIRNILKIEKLSSKDIQFLKDRNQNKQFSFDEEAKQMINDSYKEVVKDHEGYEIEGNL